MPEGIEFTNQAQTEWMCFCVMVLEQIKGALSLCLAWRMILYCWFCSAEQCGWFSWWKALGFHAIKPEWIHHANLHNLSCIWNLYKCTFDATNQLGTHIICTKSQVGAWFNSFEAWLVEISVIAIAIVNKTWCLCTKHS